MIIFFYKLVLFSYLMLLIKLDVIILKYGFKLFVVNILKYFYKFVNIREWYLCIYCENFFN